jgi:F-type H+-transporting ATPase subunit c
LPAEFAGELPLQREPGCTVSGNHLLAVFHKEAVMKKWSMLLTVLIAGMVFAPAAFAQGSAGGTVEGHAALWIAAAFGMGIAAFGCGLAQGKIGAAALEGIARNPGAAGSIFTPMLLSLAFVETLVLFTFLMIILKVK